MAYKVTAAEIRVPCMGCMGNPILLATVPGYSDSRYPGLAVTDMDGVEKDAAHRWSVTHVGTGRAVVTRYATYRAAMAAMRRLGAAAVDWTQSHKALIAQPAAREAVEGELRRQIGRQS